MPRSTALITGASSGVGAAYADRLARRGYDLVLVARDQTALNAMAAHVARSTGRAVSVIAADLTTEDGLVRVEQALRSDPTMELLVNNAGIVLNGTIAAANPVRLETMIRLNVLAPTRLAGAAIPGLVERHHGTIINIASAVALAPDLVNGAYSGTKAYVLNLSFKLQQELAGTGVRVQAVLPGGLRTAMWEKAGIDITHAVPAAMLMDAGDMVDAALVGLDNGESVTIPSLPDVEDWDRYDAARRDLSPKLSLATPARRYARAMPASARA